MCHVIPEKVDGVFPWTASRRTTDRSQRVEELLVVERWQASRAGWVTLGLADGIEKLSPIAGVATKALKHGAEV
jgi:hypothetical protein